jgi:hypothetical protein
MKTLLASSVFVMLLFATVAQATQIREFDRLSGDDQIRFVDQLAQSTQDASNGDPALSAKVRYFFEPKHTGDQVGGMRKFEMNLCLARLADIDAAAKSPHARRIEIEDVMYTTLEFNGIVLSKNFRPAALTFRPQKPLAAEYLTREDAVKALAQSRSRFARESEPEHEFRAGSHGPPGAEAQEKVLAFFGAMVALSVVANANGGHSSQGATGSANPWEQPWRPPWEKAGHNSFSEWKQAICHASRPGC